MANILISSCPYDPSTVYGYFYLKKLAGFLAAQGNRIVFLRTALLTEFRYALRKYNPRLVVLNGHGGSKGITGCDDHVILGVKTFDPELGIKILSENPEWMVGRIVYLFTCNTGKELAYRLIDYGAESVAAFKSAFIFLTEERDIPETDRLAKPFFVSSLTLPITLAKGYPWGSSCQALRDSFIYYRDLAENRRDTLQAKFLHHNLVNFVCLGNMAAYL